MLLAFARSFVLCCWVKELLSITDCSALRGTCAGFMGPLRRSGRRTPCKNPFITPIQSLVWCPLACDKPRITAIRTSLVGPRGAGPPSREPTRWRGIECLAKLVQGTVCNILGRMKSSAQVSLLICNVAMAEFEQSGGGSVRLPRVLVLKRLPRQVAHSIKQWRSSAYDESRIQAIATTPPICRPSPASTRLALDLRVQPRCTLSLFGPNRPAYRKGPSRVRDRHRPEIHRFLMSSRRRLFSFGTAIKLILDNHFRPHIEETRAWLEPRPPGRFAFTFTPSQWFCLNLIEGFFSTFSRSAFAHIGSLQSTSSKNASMAGIDDVQSPSRLHTWSYKRAEAACYDSNHENADLGATLTTKSARLLEIKQQSYFLTRISLIFDFVRYA